MHPSRVVTLGRRTLDRRTLDRQRWVTMGAMVLMAATLGCGSDVVGSTNVAGSDGPGAGADGSVDEPGGDRPADVASGGTRSRDTASEDRDGEGDPDAGRIGTVSPCGVAIECRLNGERWSVGTRGARPFDEVTCVSTGDEPGAVTVQTELLERPAGSRSRFASDSETTERASLDIAGRYLIHAVAIDGDGDALCAGTPIGVQVTPTSELHVQLVWDTPRDPDQDDVCLTCGADVDLHVARNEPAWWDPVDDVFFRNPTPDWGRPGPSTDDPRLDVDDIDGAGPENINFDVLGVDRVGVAVHYFDDNGWGESYATLRLYLYGELLVEIPGRRMVEDDFWYVGDFDPVTGTFTTRDLTWPDNQNL